MIEPAAEEETIPGTPAVSTAGKACEKRPMLGAFQFDEDLVSSHDQWFIYDRDIVMILYKLWSFGSSACKRMTMLEDRHALKDKQKFSKQK